MLGSIYVALVILKKLQLVIYWFLFSEMCLCDL
jgi:hypothetical protein